MAVLIQIGMLFAAFLALFVILEELCNLHDYIVQCKEEEDNE